jgi:hypothetical protein
MSTLDPAGISFAVSCRVDSVRPIKTRRAAPAVAKAIAVARPIPLPFQPLDVMFNRTPSTHCSSDDDGLACLPDTGVCRTDSIVRVVVPSGCR